MGKILSERVLHGDGEGGGGPSELRLQFSPRHEAEVVDASAVWTLTWIWMGMFIQRNGEG